MKTAIGQPTGTNATRAGSKDDVARTARGPAPAMGAPRKIPSAGGDDVDFAGLGGLARGRRRFGALLTLAVAFALMGVFVLVQPAILRFAPARRWWLPPLWYRMIGRLVGVRVETVGEPAGGPTLFVSNHVSWLDILVLGAVLPRPAFIAKREVASWGIFGRCARLGNVLFIDRTRRRASLDQTREMRIRLARGDSLVLFAEGTSGDGTGVRPFKSALFAVAESFPELAIQPVSVAYTHVNGIPVNRADRCRIGWFGDMELLSHVLEFIATGTVRAEVRLHPPLTFADAGSRKALARRAERLVAAGLVAARRGAATGAPATLDKRANASEVTDAPADGAGRKDGTASR